MKLKNTTSKQKQIVYWRSAISQQGPGSLLKEKPYGLWLRAQAHRPAGYGGHEPHVATGHLKQHLSSKYILSFEDLLWKKDTKYLNNFMLLIHWNDNILNILR